MQQPDRYKRYIAILQMLTGLIGVEIGQMFYCLSLCKIKAAPRIGVSTDARGRK